MGNGNDRTFVKKNSLVLIWARLIRELFSQIIDGVVTVGIIWNKWAKRLWLSWAVASDTRGPLFETSHGQNLFWTIFTVNFIEKTKNKEKEAGKRPFKKPVGIIENKNNECWAGAMVLWLWEETHVKKVVSSNLGTVYCMDSFSYTSMF